MLVGAEVLQTNGFGGFDVMQDFRHPFGHGTSLASPTSLTFEGCRPGARYRAPTWKLLTVFPVSWARRMSDEHGPSCDRSVVVCAC